MLAVAECFLSHAPDLDSESVSDGLSELRMTLSTKQDHLIHGVTVHFDGDNLFL